MGRRPSKRSDDPAFRESLAGLREVLDLTLTRILENDIDAREAQEVVAHLRKELLALERGLPPRAAPRPGAAARRRRPGPRRVGRRRGA